MRAHLRNIPVICILFICILLANCKFQDLNFLKVRILENFHFSPMKGWFSYFSSYCQAHRPQQDVPSVEDPSHVCSICMTHVECKPAIDTLRAPCCRKAWYHRDCMQVRIIWMKAFRIIPEFRIHRKSASKY